MASEPLPGDYPLTLYRGDTRVWTVVLEDNVGTEDEPVWAPKDLTGYTFDAEIRVTQDTATVMSEITAVATDAPAGEVTLTLTAVEAAKLTGFSAFWDLELTRTSDTFVRTYLSGDVEIVKDVSRA